jgi:hypothetical protein
MLTYTNERPTTYADVCWRMQDAYNAQMLRVEQLEYADVC